MSWTSEANFFLTVAAEVEPVTEHRRLPLRFWLLMELSSLRTSRSLPGDQDGAKETAFLRWSVME